MVQFNPETEQVGFDADEEYMLAFGFSGGHLLASETREAFNSARSARDAANGNKNELDRKRDGDILWVHTDNPNFAQESFEALKRYISDNLNLLYLETTPPFDTNALDYKNALAARQKAVNAIADIALIGARLELELSFDEMPNV